MQEIMPISRTGYEKLKEELRQLEEQAVEVKQRVADAREQGDLKENAEYIYGRQTLGFVQGRLGEIRGKLSFSEKRDCKLVECDKVEFGTVVKLLNLDTQEEKIYQLLGPYDFDIVENGISIVSPIGMALLGFKVGDKISVTVPRGDMNFEILEITPSEIN